MCIRDSSKPDAGYSYEGPVEHLPRNISPASIIGLPEDRIQGIILKNIDIESPGGGDVYKRQYLNRPLIIMGHMKSGKNLISAKSSIPLHKGT